jgi:hypothetical protein
MDEEGLPERLYFDQSRLTNILVNIISNGIKFTNKGGIHVYAHWFPDCGPNNNDLYNEDETPVRNISFKVENLESQQTHTGQVNQEERKDQEVRSENHSGISNNNCFLIG